MNQLFMKEYFYDTSFFEENDDFTTLFYRQNNRSKLPFDSGLQMIKQIHKKHPAIQSK